MAAGTIRVELLDGSQAAKLIGELDLSAYDKATTDLQHLFGAAGDVRLDLSELTFVDSSGVRLFLRLHDSVKGSGRLVLFAPTPHVEKVIDVSGLIHLGIEVEPARDA